MTKTVSQNQMANLKQNHPNLVVLGGLKCQFYPNSGGENDFLNKIEQNFVRNSFQIWIKSFVKYTAMFRSI